MIVKLIICLDENSGQAFNKRRQSRDSKVIERILEICGNSPLYMSEYSKELFSEKGIVKEPQKGEFYFAEIEKISENPEEIYIFWWNRLYPSDLKFSVDLKNYDLLENSDFCGTSHERITLSHYRRKK